MLAVRGLRDDEERKTWEDRRKQKESRSTGAVSELRAAVKFALHGKAALTDEERAAVNIDGNAAILPEQFVNDIQGIKSWLPKP